MTLMVSTKFMKKNQQSVILLTHSPAELGLDLRFQNSVPVD